MQLKKQIYIVSRIRIPCQTKHRNLSLQKEQNCDDNPKNKKQCMPRVILMQLSARLSLFDIEI